MALHGLFRNIYWSVIALGLCIATDGAHAQGQKVHTCTSKPVQNDHIYGVKLQDGAKAARVFLVRFSPSHSVLRFDASMVEIWDTLGLWERSLDEALADPTMPVDIRTAASEDATTQNWMTYLVRYHRAIAALENVDTTKRETIDAAIEHYVRTMPDRMRTVASPDDYRGMLIGTQKNYETERGLPSWQALLQATHAVQNHLDGLAGQIVTEKNIESAYTQGRRDWQLRLALSNAEVKEAVGEGFDQRLLGHYISYRDISLNCAGYLYREGINLGAHESVRRLLEWLPFVKIEGVNWHAMGFETRDWEIALLAKQDFAACFLFVNHTSDPARKMEVLDLGCDGDFGAIGDATLTPLQERQAAIFMDYAVFDATRWTREWAGVSEVASGPTLAKYLRSKSDFFESQSNGIYDIDITTVTTSQTLETQNGLSTVTDSSTTESRNNYPARTIGVTLGPDKMRLLFYGTDGEWQCFHGLLGVGRTQLLDNTFLGFKEEVDRVIFNTGGCPTPILSSMFINERSIDGLFGTILVGGYMKEVNGLIYILSQSVISAVEALERVEG
jgi:hypothetical protein